MVNSKTKCFFIWYVLCFEKYEDHHKIGLDGAQGIATGLSRERSRKKERKGIGDF